MCAGVKNSDIRKVLGFLVQQQATDKDDKVNYGGETYEKYVTVTVRHSRSHVINVISV